MNNQVEVEVCGAQKMVPCTYKTVVLKPNIVNDKNILTQGMMSTPDTKYVIKSDFIIDIDIVNSSGNVSTSNVSRCGNPAYAGALAAYNVAHDAWIAADNAYTNDPNETTLAAKNAAYEAYQRAEATLNGTPQYYYYANKAITVKKGRRISIPDDCVILDSALSHIVGFETAPVDTVVYIGSLTAGTYSYNIQNAIVIPSGCLIEFDGGSISNGTLIGNETILVHEQELEEVLINVPLFGTFVEQAGGTSTDKKDNVNGMGKIYLRKDKSFASQVIQANTIYVIQYDFDLGGESVTIPANCVLKFDGGSLRNGTVVFNNTGVQSVKACFGTNLEIVGKVLEEASPEWFVGTDADKIEKAINYFSVVKLAARDYQINRMIVVAKSFKLSGCSIPDCFGKFRGTPTDYSQTRLIATENIDAIIKVDQDNGNNLFHSIVFDSVSFTCDDSVSNLVNGIELTTPGGPSRPVVIEKCNFKKLNYGIYIYGSIAGNSTNISNLHICNCNITFNNWGLYVSGRNALICTDIDNNVIEHNVQGGIYVYDDDPDYYSAFSNFALRNNLLEGQPEIIYIKSNGSVCIEGNYFEAGSESQKLHIFGELTTIVAIKNNYIPRSGSVHEYYIEKCQIVEFMDNYMYDFHVKTHFDTCAFLSRPNVPITEVHSCFACYDDSADVKISPTIESFFTKNFFMNGSMCMRSTPTNEDVLMTGIPQQGSVAAGNYRMVFYTINENRIAIVRLLDSVNNVYYGPNVGNNNTSMFNVIKEAYRKKCIRYLTDVVLPDISAFEVVTIFYKDVPNVSAVSEIGLYDLAACDYIPSMGMKELYNDIYVGESDYYEVKHDYAYRSLSSATVGQTFTDSPVETVMTDCCEIAVKAHDIIDLKGVCHYLILDSDNKVLKKVTGSTAFFPPKYTERISVDGKVIINVFNEKFENYSGTLIPYANTHHIPYKFSRITLGNY